jgi:hypothetical protein
MVYIDICDLRAAKEKVGAAEILTAGNPAGRLCYLHALRAFDSTSLVLSLHPFTVIKKSG